MQVACIKTVVQTREEIMPLFDALRQACGDAVCGPAMAIYHFGAAQTGFLVEAAFPVNRPVETNGVYTRKLEDARVTAITHTGPHESIRDTVSQLYEYGRTHAGAAGGLQRWRSSPGRRLD